MLDKPPDVVPDGLSAEEYFRLGNWYHESRLMNQARDAFNRAIELDPAGPSGLNAKRIRDANLTRHEVPDEAVKKYQDVNLLMVTRPPVAIKTLTELIEQHPNFEWPYHGLATMRLRKGDAKEALSLVEKALEINPDYGQAAVLKAQVLISVNQYRAASEALDLAARLLPDSAEVRDLRRSLEIIIHMDN